MKTLTAVLFLLVVFSILALADSGYYWSNFSNPQPYTPHKNYGLDEHPDVVMADEFVSIVLGADGAVVNAEFTFRNEGAAQMVPMYFPLSSHGGMAMVDEEGYQRYLDNLEALSISTVPDEYGNNNLLHTVTELFDSDYNFTANADGKALETRILTENSLELRSDYEENSPFDEGGIYYEGRGTFDEYAIYEVFFAAGKTLMLTVSYEQKYNDPDHGDWWEMIYPIDTGLSWKGAIGHGIVEVTAGSGFDWNGVWQYRSIFLPPAIEKDSKLIWEFDELDPDFSYNEIVISMPVKLEKPCWGIVVAESGINFRSERNNTSARVAAHLVMKVDEFFTIFERQGDWWRIEDEEGNSGWLRWRYVDTDTDTENIYAAITPSKSKNGFNVLFEGA